MYMILFNYIIYFCGTKETIINEGKAEQFDSLIDELYPDGITDTQLNDLLWFEEDWIFEMLGIEIDEE